MRKRLFFVMAVFLCHALFAQNAENPDASTIITLDDALSLALKNNVSIKREEITLAASKRAASHSWNALLPSVSVSANDEMELPDLAKGKSAGGNTDFQNTFGFEGKISVSISSDLFASIKKTKLDYESARISFEQAVMEIQSQVKETYFSLLLAEQNLNLLRENLENAKNQAEQNAERYRRGTLSELEYLSSKVSYEKLKPELKAQELSFRNEKKSFFLFLGLDEEQIKKDQMQYTGSLEDFLTGYKTSFSEAKKNLVAEAVKNGEIPSILNLQKQIEAAQKSVDAARLSAYGPSANISYAVTPVITGSDKGRIKQSASIGVSIPVENLLPFSKGADSIREAQDSVKDLKLQLAEKRRTVSTDFSYLLESIEQKKESVQALKDFVGLAQANYESARYAYSKGMIEFLSMQNASKEILEAKQNLQNEFLENLKLYIALEKLCGTTANALTL